MALGLGLCGACCEGCDTGTARFRVFGCTPAGTMSPIQIALADIVITLAGDPIANLTSSATTRVSTGSILAPGTYDVSVDFNRYEHFSGTFTIGPSCDLVDVDLDLEIPEGMVCCSNLGGKLVPDTLYVTDENDTWTLTYNSSLSAWLACGTAPGFSTFRWHIVSGTSTCSDETVDVPYSLRIVCNAGGAGSNFSVGWKTVQSCSSTDWTTAVADCDGSGAVAQPTFDADGAVNPTHYQTASGIGFGSINLTSIPINGTIAHLSSVADGGGHAGVATNAPAFGPFVIAE